jgi:diaminopimelate decarboxylase
MYPQHAWLPPTALAAVAAEHGTPTYVYSAARIVDNYRRLADAFAREAGRKVALHYAVKANANAAILRLLRECGAGFDVVSGGELRAALRAEADPASIVFAGVGKRNDEIVAALDADIGWFNVESAQELRVLSDLAAARGRVQRIALRVNPGLDPRTHAYLATGKSASKFGLPPDDALALVRERAAFPGVSIEGLHVHNGSTITDTQVFADSARVMIDMVARCRAAGAAITHLDMGGGFGVPYMPGQPHADIDGIARALVQLARAADVALAFEPGRYLVADAGALVTQVLFTKESGGKRFAVVDAAMNDLIRPALYGAVHHIAPLAPRDGEHALWEVVGPVCESGDFLGHDVPLPPVQRGDLLVVGHIGAYGRSMASNYNLRPRAAEVLLVDGAARLVRPREDVDALM